MTLPLDGIRVADFSWVLAGPLCTKYLATMGAEVIKIESFDRPDYYRNRQPFADGIPGMNRAGSFNTINFSKKDCTLNLKHPKAVALTKEIIEISDVVVENFAGGVMERLGLDYESLKKIKPDIIMMSSSGLGKEGPGKDFVAYGTTLHAFTGLTGLTGYEDGEPRGIGGTWVDPVTGTIEAFAIMAALHHRSKTGEGQLIDLSMAEVQISLMPEAVMDYIMNGRVQKPRANQDDWMAPHACYPCKGEDKWVAIAVANDEEWEALCKAIGKPELVNDARFADSLSRWKNQKELDPIIAQWTQNYTHYEAAAILQRAGVAAGPSLDPSEVAQDPHLLKRGYIVTLDHPEVGVRQYAGIPWKISGVPKPYLKHAPLIGEHNEYVFHELLGLPTEEVKQLMEAGAIR